MSRRRTLGLLLLALALPACDRLPGRPTPSQRYEAPQAVLNPAVLFSANCSGCHGEPGRVGPARDLGDQLFHLFLRGQGQVFGNVPYSSGDLAEDLFACPNLSVEYADSPQTSAVHFRHNSIFGIASGGKNISSFVVISLFNRWVEQSVLNSEASKLGTALPETVTR